MNYRWLSLPLGNNGEPFVQYMCFPLNTTTCYYGTEIKAYGIPKKKNTMEKFTFKKRDPKKKISKFLCYYIESKQKRQAQKKNIKRVYGKAWEPGLGHGRRPFYFYFFYFHFFTIIIVFILYICFGGLTACSLGAWASLWSWDRIRTKGHADTREYRFELSSNRCRCLL